MAITIGTARKGQYAILRSTHTYLVTAAKGSSYNRYRLVEVHSATRDGKVKTYRPYGETGGVSGNRPNTDVFFALGDVWCQMTRRGYNSMDEILDSIKLHVRAPLLAYDKELS